MRLLRLCTHIIQTVLDWLAAIEHCKLYSDTKSKKFITRNISTIMYNVFHTEPDGEQFMIGLIKDGVLTDTALRKMLSKMDKDTYLEKTQ